MIKSPNHHYLRALIIFVVLIMIVLGGYWLEHHVTMVETWIRNMGHWASVAYILLFTVLTPFFVSVDLLCIIAGALFSLPLAIFDVMVGTMIAAAVIFVAGRHFAQEPIRRILRRHPKLEEVDRLIGNGGLKMLFLIRLLPLPFALTGYTFSVSRVSFLDYWLATSGIFFYNSAITYFGYLAGHLSKQMIQGADYSGPSNTALLFGVVFCLTILVLIARLAKSEIDRIKNSNPSN